MPNNNLQPQGFNPNLIQQQQQMSQGLSIQQQQQQGVSQARDLRQPAVNEQVTERPSIVTNTSVRVEDILKDERFHAMIARFQWQPTAQNSGTMVIVTNRSGHVGLFLEQSNMEFVNVAARSLVSPQQEEYEGLVCSSLHDALQACYNYMRDYSTYDAFRR